MPDAPLIPIFEEARGALTAFGYKPNWAHRDYEIPLDRNGSGKWPIDYVVFCDSNATLVNAAFTLQRWSPDPAGLVSQKLSRTTAPFHLLLDVENPAFEFWTASIAGGVVQAQQVISRRPLSRLSAELETYGRDFAPATLKQVKAGKASFSHIAFRDVRALQLGLFVEEVTGQILTEHFSHILNLLRERSDQPEAMVSRLSIELLAARILADAGVLAAGQDLATTIAEAHQHDLGRYFDAVSSQIDSAAVSEAFVTLSTVSFKTFTPDMLRSLYPAAYPPAVRRKLGRYDTPLFLTQRILDNLPLETLRPEQRQVADMTCGWGSFLVAAHRRLAALPDSPFGQLNRFIVGNDIDPTTANLASLSLLLSSNHDSWRIDHEDALQWNWLNNNQPGVIVGNPPFGANLEHRRGIDAVYRFVAHAISRLAEGGFLAMVVPASLKIKPAANSLRSQLFKGCDVWEIWEVPGGIFTEAKVQPIVIFARKDDRGGRGSTVVRRAGPSALERQGLENGHFTRSAILTDNRSWLQRKQATAGGIAEAVLWTPVILSEQRWATLAARRLVDVAEITNGMIRGHKTRRYRDYFFPSQVQLLEDTNLALSIVGDFYVDISAAVQVIYPNDFAEPGLGTKDKLFARPKIVMTATMAPQWGKMVKVGVDYSGVFVNNNFNVVTPKEIIEHEEGITVEALAAVLRWRVINGWICEHREYPWISQPVLSDAPFPPRQERNFWMKVTHQVKELRQLASQGTWDTGREKEVDQMLDDAYGLGAYPQDSQLLETIYRWRERVVSGTPFLDPPSPPAPNAPLYVAGKVESVDAASGTFRAWIDALADSVELAITTGLPGWLLREGASFEATLLRSKEGQGRKTNKYYELVAVSGEDYCYMDVDEARQRLEERLSR